MATQVVFQQPAKGPGPCRRRVDHALSFHHGAGIGGCKEPDPPYASIGGVVALGFGIGAVARLAARRRGGHRRVAGRGIAHHQNRQGQQQDGAGHHHHAPVRLVVVRDVGDQQAGQRGDGHIDHEADRHVVGLD
jgi:hypothetical protein